MYKYDHKRISKYIIGLYINKLYSEKKSITWSEMKQILADKMGFWSTIPVNEKQTKQLEQLFEQVFKNFSANEEKACTRHSTNLHLPYSKFLPITQVTIT